MQFPFLHTSINPQKDKQRYVIIQYPMASCSQDHFANIKDKFVATVEQIRQEYRHQLEKLKEEIAGKDRKIDSLQKNIKKKQAELSEIKVQHIQFQQKTDQLQSIINSLQSERNQSAKAAQIKSQQHEQEIDSYNQILKDKEDEIYQLKKQETFSIDQSNVSFQNTSQQNFSVQISQLFVNSPHQILKFLQSIEGELTQDVKQKGDMTCMFVSRDGLSLDKYDNINRTFLKRKIKQNQKRFRFVLIHKPDQ